MNDMSGTMEAIAMTEAKISARKVQVYYGDTHAIKDVDLDIGAKAVTAFIGPPAAANRLFCAL